MDSKQLYQKLYAVRDRLKNKFYSNGRTPTICTDEALYELAEKAPRHKEDLANINGLGQTFADKYGDYFMVVLNQYHNSNVSTKTLKNEIKSTLKNLENRLVNISKRNRLLYMGKIYNKYAFDLFSSKVPYNNDVVDLLFGKKHSLKLCNIGEDDEIEIVKRYKKILSLLREVTKDFRENGQYDLYIGYPYVMGRTKGENFNVRAPLLLFPVNFNKEDKEITLTLDKSKDVLFNNNLILLQNKFLSKNDELPNNVYDDIKSQSFNEDVLNFYDAAGIHIISQDDIFDLRKFNDFKVNEFPEFKNGEFYICPNAILGKFSLYSSALQKDFKNMIDDSEINDLLDELLSGMEQLNYYTDEICLDDDDDKEEKAMAFSEKNLNYINELDSSQEQAILSVDKNDKLVIQGPPGTGKSQTITSLIADTVNKGHNVLMVSQKKAALDVIYSRLGNLSKYALMLNDVKNKEHFYKQLYDLFVCEKKTDDVRNDFLTTSSNIDENLNLLNKIADILYSSNSNGIEMYKIYQENTTNIFKDKNNIENVFYENVNNSLFNIHYKDLKLLKEKFTNSILIETIYKYIDIISRFPFINDLKDTFKTFEVRKMENDFNEFIKEQEEYLKKNFIKRFFTAKKRKKAINVLFDNYFNKTTYKQSIFKFPEKLNNVCEFYITYQEAKKVYDSLSETEELYIKTLYKINRIDNKIATNGNLYDFIVFCIIKQFEYDNSLLLSNISNFNSIIKQINKLINQKKDLTKVKFKNILVNAYRKEIYQSKRYNEMCRQIESSRKWSVSKFIKKFNFELFKGIKIWLMTPESVSEVLPLEKGLFDLLIFDEASQIYIEKGIPAISRTHKVVIAGDHKQLRPSSLGVGRIEYEDDETETDELEDNAALEEESLLDLARFKYPSVLLNYHYRSRYEELINFSNYAFYNGRLNVSPNTEDPSSPPIEVIKIDNGMWIDRSNRNEALKVVQTIKDFLLNRKNNESLGVITFNSNQRDLIMDELDNECLKDTKFSVICKKEFERKDNGEDVGLFIKNIENVQGDERDCIIFSIGYAKNESGRVVRNFGWLNQKGGENRLNVAISRAKQKIYVITSILPDELFVDDLKNDGPKICKKYLEYCWAINNRDKESAKRILYSFADEKRGVTDNVSFDSEFENQVYDALVDKGLIVDTQVGVGGYKIDLALRDKDNKKYLLGIECDGKLYHSSMLARERDIYRQKYLESRGWKIYRIWSTNWWHNPEREINNILKIYSTLK